ncbi:major facilitator superfamily domain-containing protein [Irpex rosettiformis]|uniref:Major facilitator superfamily domain-containing protein n=1 Tax=Irpex rosettiformis TaxID=378272 RepID=A0ACB8U248_9APHY|nr:major facilitator superfamily domain-containing protein [Irpex rosettiformis]
MADSIVTVEKDPRRQQDDSPGELSPPLVTSQPTPLPKVQLALLLYLQLAEPITSTVIYPFVNQLVRRTGITKGNDDKTGYFVGAIESVFYAVEALCVLHWGRASDILGRKPVLVSGLCGLALSMIGFAFSTQYWAMILSRCAQGALNGNIGVTKSMMGEITDASNRAQGFAFMPLVWTTGCTWPLLGGVLADPNTQYGTHLKFLAKYPYFLPCICTAAISVSAALCAFLFLRETVPNARIWIPCIQDTTRQSDPPTASPVADRALVSSEANNEGEKTSTTASSSSEVLQSNVGQEPRPSLRSLLVRRTILPILNYAFLAFVDDAFLILQPLMYSTVISDGGLGFKSLTTGVILGVWGVIDGVFQIWAFPKVLKRFGPKKVYVFCYSGYLLCYATFPILSTLAKREGSVNTKVWVVLILQLAAYLVAYTCYGIIFIYIADGAPSRAALGATNGLAQMVASTMRAMAPVGTASLFAVSTEKNISGGFMVYWILIAVVTVGIGVSFLLPSQLLEGEANE